MVDASGNQLSANPPLEHPFDVADQLVDVGAGVPLIRQLRLNGQQPQGAEVGNRSATVQLPENAYSGASLLDRACRLFVLSVVDFCEVEVRGAQFNDGDLRGRGGGGSRGGSSWLDGTLSNEPGIAFLTLGGAYLPR
jgi:hypothetical protein